jgi:hypothetical protein
LGSILELRKKRCLRIANTFVYTQKDKENKLSVLWSFKVRFNGFCELICNQILLEDLLGKKEADQNFHKEKITSKTLSDDRITKSHETVHFFV